MYAMFSVPSTHNNNSSYAPPRKRRHITKEKRREKESMKYILFTSSQRMQDKWITYRTLIFVGPEIEEGQLKLWIRKGSKDAELFVVE